MPWVGLQFVIVVFSNHTHLHFALYPHICICQVHIMLKIEVKVVMGGTLAQIFFKPEKNLEFFRLKICARDAYPGKLE